ncbi:hypothetical protein QJS10_CPB18g00584 [Acorus calamus]|uniref:Mitochondrial inner membrane protease ATP23 n=1 Tax=Acorus calamus TaxID=4465 RepID=A0AAV9CNX4_ACOCL|nr:hypothetical protein QJS10_CPB18g00584 [Acorus calamus]
MSSEDAIPNNGITINGGRTIEECQKMIQKCLKRPMVKFLMENMEKAGCGVGRNFFKAVECDKEISGGYSPGEGILVCSNHMRLQDDVNQVVIHELIHAYDDCRAANLDWSDCAHHACSEIRAGHLSGDCHYKRELLRSFVKLRGHEQPQQMETRDLQTRGTNSQLIKKECVRRRVMKSVLANPHCSESAAKDAMAAVWDTCYNDTSPFDRAP